METTILFIVIGMLFNGSCCLDNDAKNDVWQNNFQSNEDCRKGYN